MIQPEIQEIMNYFSTPEDPSEAFLANVIGSTVTNIYLTDDLTNYRASFPTQELLTPNISYINNNSTSDEADCRFNIINERKMKRMISNRESARRSRMRKQTQLDELWSQVVRLRNVNNSLMDRLGGLSESHERVVRDNGCLKVEVSDLRKLVRDLQMSSSLADV